jgi:hypothetical protein
MDLLTDPYAASDSYSYVYFNEHNGSHCKFYAYINVYTVPDADCYANSHPHTHPHPDANIVPYCLANTYIYIHFDEYIDANFNLYS